MDPSFEVKEDYVTIPRHIAKLHRAWNVGIIALWYPILASKAHLPMLGALTAAHPDAMRHEVSFPPARPGHGMTGSGMFILNPPFGLKDEAMRLGNKFKTLT
jgi:23S rRNA (adenine2030-N6)-methyltransferase